MHMKIQFWIRCLLVGIVSLLLPNHQTRAQTLAQHNWYFGNSAQGIQFDRGNNTPVLVTNQALPFGNGGAATATDIINANVLFYSDGNVVYDACHLPMPGTAGIGGLATANQPVAITPVPGQTNRYFLFTNSANFTTGGTIRRLVINMNAPGSSIFPAPPSGEGEGSVGTLAGLINNRSEGMITVPHANGIDFWLITHQNNSNIFSATRIDANSYSVGFISPPPQAIPELLPTSVAHMAYHAASGKIAVAPQDPNTNATILNFDDATGTFTFDQTIINSGVATLGNQSIYDVEWSRNGRFVYLSRHGDASNPANVFQYDTQNPTVTLAPLLTPAPFRSYGLQLAPDSAIYHLYQATAGGSFLMGRFTETDTIASEVIYEPLPLGNTNFNGRQFPSFLPQSNPTLTVSFTSLGTCENSPTSFFPTVTPAADSLRWDFGDGETSGNWSPVYTYQSASTFNVSLTAFFQGQPTTISQPVTINPFPLQLQLVQDTTACRSEFPSPRGSSSPVQFSVPLEITGGSATSIVWSNGDTGLNLTPDSAGYYFVVVTDASGCSGYAGVNVKEYGLQDQRFNIWYFGDRAGLDFNVQPVVGIPAGTRTMNAPEGVSIVCDRNGDVIFYTDGDRVYDEDDTEIDSGIGGDPTSTQSALIVQVPDDETLYYIFTTQAISGTSQYRLSYSLFDLKLNSGKGDIVQKNITLFTRSTERITANEQWLIAHEYGNNIFRSYPITAQGIGDPVFTSIGAEHSFKSVANGEGYMKLGPRNNLAVALATPGTSNRIELFHLVDSTGRITNLRPINLNQPAGQVYGIEFSTGGNKLYATIKGPPSQVVEYFLDSLDRPFFRNRTNNPAELGAIQRGPDGQIYFAINGSSVLGTIAPNEDTTAVSVVNFTGQDLAGSRSRLGLPNFIQNTGNAFGGPSLSFADGCLGTPTQFDVVPTDPIDTWDLFFGDGASVKDSTRAFHTYATAATFSVSLIMTNRCGLDTTLTRPITIFNPPPPPSLPGAIALCTGTVLLNANIPNTPNLDHLWTTLDDTPSITVDEQGTYGVTNTDRLTRCTSTAQVIVADNRPQVELGANETFCQNQSVSALPSDFPGLDVEWRITDPTNTTTTFPNYTSPTFPVDTSSPGSFIYTLTVTNNADPLNPCTNTDSKTYTFNVSPNFVLSAVNPTGCGLSNGSVTLQINATTPASGPFSYLLTGPSGFSQSELDRNPPYPFIRTFTGRPSGIYTAVVTNQISGCTNLPQLVGLNDPSFSATAASQAPNCEPVIVRVTPSVMQNYTYRFINNATSVVTGPFVSNLAFFDSPGLTAGVYTIEVRDNTNCIFTFPHTVAPNAPVALTVTSNLCTIPNPTLTASAGASFVWTGPGIVGASNIPTIQINQSGIYQVTATAGGQCPNTQSITITLPPVITPDFVQTDPCADNVILTATPTGNFTYRWLRNGAPTAFIGRQISLGVADAGSYQVEVRNTQTGCVTLQSPAKPVTIVGIITASLTAEQACNDDQPFTLTATSNASGVAFAWFLDNNPINGATTASIDQTSEGLYRVEVTRATCTASAEIRVLKAPVPVGSLLDRVIICNDPDNRDPETASVELDPGASDSRSTFVAFNWFKNQVSAGSVDRVFTADSEGIYEVDITNNFNCVSRDQTEVLNDCVPRITAPNAFRPTSKVADNLAFRVFSLFITDEFQILIYNRWGELVFESKDRDFRWNGTYNNTGAALPGGTYAYIVKYVSRFRPEKGIQEQRGGVVLLR
jgi:gliding motility-associated-like protein